MNRSTKDRFRFFTRLLTTVPAMLIFISGFSAAPARASAPNRVPANYTSIAQAPNGGYWIQVDDGDNFYTLAIDGAPQYQSVPEPGSITAVPGTSGYWVVTTDGHIYARGGAPELCGGNPGWLPNCSGYRPSRNPITGVAASPNGDGLWAVDYTRHVWTAGNVVSYGDVTNDNRRPSGIVATPSGLGYYIVMNDGGVFTRGDAVFYGSTGGTKPGGHDVTGLALSFNLTGKQTGYWLVADDGGIFTFGDAPFLGSTGGNDGGSIVTSVVTRLDRHSYAWVHANARLGLSRTLPRVTIDKNTPVPVGVWGVESNNSNAGIYVQSPNGSTSQQWDLWPTNPAANIVQIVNVSSGLCADVENTVGPYIIQYPCKGNDDVTWNNRRFNMTTYDPMYCYTDSPCVGFSPLSSQYEYVNYSGDNSQLLLIPFSAAFWTIISLDANGQPASNSATSPSH